MTPPDDAAPLAAPEAAAGHAITELLAGFIQELRQAGLPVSLTENLDAMEAVKHIPLDDREAFKYALAATLVKNNAHWRAFETVFEVYFSYRGPEYELDPDSDLGDEAAITVTGTNFGSTENHPALLEVCRVGDASRCDEQTSTELTPDNAGGFTVELAVAATFPIWSGETVDCREAPGCEVVARLGYQGRRATAPLAFGPPGSGGERYLDLVFDDVDVTSGIVYRHTSDAAGTGVDLTLDVYQPAGDTEEQRPVVVWLRGGWFGGAAGPDMGAYAEAFARRGYVSVTMTYRQRPGLRCCPTDDIEGVTAVGGPPPTTCTRSSAAHAPAGRGRR